MVGDKAILDEAVEVAAFKIIDDVIAHPKFRRTGELEAQIWSHEKEFWTIDSVVNLPVPKSIKTEEGNNYSLTSLITLKSEIDTKILIYTNENMLAWEVHFSWGRVWQCETKTT